MTALATGTLEFEPLTFTEPKKRGLGHAILDMPNRLETLLTQAMLSPEERQVAYIRGDLPPNVRERLLAKGALEPLVK